MDNQEEVSERDDQHTSWRVDHENSVTHNQPVQEGIQEERQLLDGGPLSNHLIDLERQQIHQQTSLARGQSLFQAGGPNCMETSLDEAQQRNLNSESLSNMFQRSNQKHTNCEESHNQSEMIFDPEASYWQQDQGVVQTSNMIDWQTEVVGNRMLLRSQDGGEPHWDPQSSSTRLEGSSSADPHHKGSSQFSFYPSQPTLRDMQQSENDEMMLTARTTIADPKSSFEPKFEHEEVSQHLPATILFQNVPSSSDNLNPKMTAPGLIDAQNLLFSPSNLSGAAPIKLGDPEGPNELSRNEEISREHRQSNTDSDFFKLEDCVSHQSEQKSPKKLGVGYQHQTQLQGGLVPTQPMLTLEDAAEASNKAQTQKNENDDNDVDEQFDPADYTDHLYDSDGGSAQQSQTAAFRQAAENNYSSYLRSSEPQQTLRNAINSSIFNGNLAENLVSPFNCGGFQPRSSSDHNLLQKPTQQLQQQSKQPNLLFQPFQRIKSVPDINDSSPTLTTRQNLSAGRRDEERKADQSQAQQTSQVKTTIEDLRDSARTAITQLIRNNVSIMRENEAGSPSGSSGPQEESKSGDSRKQSSQHSYSMPHPDQLKSYEQMVAQIIRDSIEKENRALKQQIKQLQMNEQKRNHMRNPFQPKNPKIFSKPNFPVSKSFSGRGNSGNFKYRPGGFNFQHPNRSSFQTGANTQQLQKNEQAPSSRHIVSPKQYSKKDESFEGSEVIEELIEIEESGDEYEQSQNGSFTVRTNLAGGRGSIVSNIDDNNSHIYEELKQNGGRLSPQAVLSQRFFDHQSFYGFRRDLTRVQNAKIGCTSSMSQAPENQQLEYEDLEALFNYQADHLTENEESEVPFYVPSCMDSQQNMRHQGSELFGANGDDTNIAKRLNFQNDNQSVDAIYNSTAFDLVKSTGSERGNYQRLRSLDQIGIEESKGDAQARFNQQTSDPNSSLYNADKQVSESPQIRTGGAMMTTAQKDFGNIDDDDIVNQNSSHDGRSHHNRSILHLTHSTFENVNSPLRQAESALIQEETKQAKVFNEKATQMSNADRFRKSTESSIKKLDGPQIFTYFSAQSLADDRWICPICLDVFQDAVETPCCHNLFCEKCIKNTRNCPLCNMRIIGNLKPNIPIRRLVLELSVNCPNANCKSTVKRQEQERHLEVCDYTELECPNNSQRCGTILRKDMQRHTNQECLFRKVACLLNCGFNLVLNEMDDHIANDCSKAELNCRNECGKIILRGLMEDHLKGDCPEQVVDCSNKGESLFEDGCSMVLRRRELESHLQNCIFRRIMCPNQKCSSVIMFKNLETHDERCLFKVIECDNKCGTKVLRQNIQQHKDVCEYQLVKCPYYDLGCKIEILRKDYRQHLIEENFNHSIVFIEGQKKKNKEIEDLQTEIQSLRKDYDSEMQWMYVEMQMMKEQVKKILKQGNSSGNERETLENNNSSFGDNNIASYQRRHAAVEESKEGTLRRQQAMQQYSFVFANRGAQGENNANYGHFGGTRYNQIGAQSMSVASVSLANNRQSVQNLNTENQNQNQNQLVDISDELEPRVPTSQQNGRESHLIEPRRFNRQENLAPHQNEMIRPITRRGRNNGVSTIVDLRQQASADNKGSQPIRGVARSTNLDQVFDSHSADYYINNRQSSIRNSHEGFLNEDRSTNMDNAMHAFNPLTAIDGARTRNDSEGADRDQIDSRPSLSAAVGRQEPRMVAKPPLSRHQLFRTSEPDYSASQNNSLTLFNGANGQNAQSINQNHSFSRAGAGQEGSERKNPLAYLLASANASIDTNHGAGGHNDQSNNIFSKEPTSGPRRQNLFREEPPVESSSQANADDSVLNILDRFSQNRREENSKLSDSEKQKLLQTMQTQEAQRQQERNFREILQNGALLSSSATGGLRQHRIRKVQVPAARSHQSRARMMQAQQQQAATISEMRQAPQTRNNKNDLDSSNVLYDEDFEIEEEKVNTSTTEFQPTNGNIFHPR